MSSNTAGSAGLALIPPAVAPAVVWSSAAAFVFACVGAGVGVAAVRVLARRPSTAAEADYDDAAPAGR